MLGNGFEHFLSLDSFRKASFVLDSEQWEDKLLEGFILDVWELRKVRLYGDNPSVNSPSLRLQLHGRWLPPEYYSSNYRWCFNRER